MFFRSAPLLQNDREFKIVHITNSNDRIIGSLLFGKNELILSNKCCLIREYAKKADPNARLPDIITASKMTRDDLKKAISYNLIEMVDKETKKLDLHDLLSTGFCYYVDFSILLPRPVKALYGESPISEDLGRCFAVGPLATGLFPTFVDISDIERIEFFASEPLFEELLDKTTLALGDIIQLGCVHNSTFVHSHDFVYLDSDISISINGVAAPLLLHYTTDILQIYKPNALADNFNFQNNNEIRILRKNNRLHYPEELMESLLSYYDIVKANMQHDSKMKDFLKIIFYHFKNFCNKLTLSDDTVNKFLKSVNAANFSSDERAIYRVIRSFTSYLSDDIKNNEDLTTNEIDSIQLKKVIKLALKKAGYFVHDINLFKSPLATVVLDLTSRSQQHLHLYSY